MSSVSFKPAGLDFGPTSKKWSYLNVNISLASLALSDLLEIHMQYLSRPPIELAATPQLGCKLQLCPHLQLLDMQDFLLCRRGTKKPTRDVNKDCQK